MKVLGAVLAVGAVGVLAVAHPARAHVDLEDDPASVVIIVIPDPQRAPTQTSPSASPTEAVLGPVLHQYPDKADEWVGCDPGRIAEAWGLAEAGDWTLNVKTYEIIKGSYQRLHRHTFYDSDDGWRAEVDPPSNYEVRRIILSHPTWGSIDGSRCLDVAS